MAVLALSAIGAGVGFGIAGTLAAASWGWTIGSVVGNLLFAPKPPGINQEGPRLGDLKVQASTYGNPIPVLYGTMRLSGNMIWSTPINETRRTTSQSGGGGGKGGGHKQTVTQTTYSYSQSFAIALCEGTIAGVRKIWANGKLIYNIADDASIASVVASNNAASGIRIYLGSESQTADALIQANIGAADTPAYRGTAYVVFENLQLGDYGNRAPNLEFEVLRAMGYVHPAGERTDFSIGNNLYFPGFDPVTKSIWYGDIANNITKIDVTTLASVSYACGGPREMAFDSINKSMWVAGAGNNYVSKLDIFSGAKVTYATGNFANGAAFDPVTNSIWVANNNAGTVSKVSIFADTRVDYAVGSNPKGCAFDSLTNSVWVANSSSGTVSKIDIFNGSRVDYATQTNPYEVAFDPVTNSVWVTNNGSASVSKIDVLTGSRVDYATQSGPWGIAFDSATNSVWVANYVTFSVSKLDIFGVASRVDYATNNQPMGVAFDSATNNIWVATFSGGTLHRFNVQDWGMAATAPALSSIVSDICTRAGLTGGQIDVTALTDSVSGYIVQRSTARSQIQQLMQAFFFDAVESDGKIKFVKRGGASAAAIAEADLAAHDHGSAPTDPLMISRTQEMELPVEVAVQYVDTAAGYQVGTQLSQRLTTSSQDKQSVNLAIAMTSTKAKQISDVLMYDAWTSRMKFSMANGWKYSYLEPTDIVTVTADGRSYTMRLISEDGGTGVHARRAVLEDTTVYTQTATAVTLPVADGTVGAVPLTNLQLLDIPLLRDQDNGVGFYAVAGGYTSGWPGSETFKSSDDGATWNIIGEGMLHESAIGTATTALGNFSTNIFDEFNSVTVTLTSGSLASDSEINVLNGANVALLGSEIIQFKNATLLSGKTYALTGLLRGRQGTEWACGSHAIGDRFVLLASGTTYLFTGSTAEYHLSRRYRGVSFGGYLDDALDVVFTNNAVAQMPYAPVWLNGNRNPSTNDWSLDWIRRTRVSGAWKDYIDAPVSETSESYEIDIFSSNTYATLKRTLSGLSTPAATYTSAQQVTDFGSNQGTLYVKVYQLSASVGRGYPLTTSITR